MSLITNLKLGGAGGINFASNDADAESGIGGFKLYNDGAVAVPVLGSGGVVPAQVTLATTASGALRGLNSYLFTKDATNRQGVGISYDFTIDSMDKGRVIAVTMEYLASSGFAVGNLTSDFQMYIYDKTNGTMQQLVPNGFTTLNDKFRGIFQAAANSTSYRLVMHIATTSAVAWTYLFDNFKIGPQSDSGVSQGSIITDWQSYNMAITGTGGNPTFGTISINNAQWRRVGDSMEIAFTFRQTTAGTAGSGEYRFGLPPGYSIDPIKYSTTYDAEGINSSGSGQMWSAGGSYHLEVGVGNAQSLFIDASNNANATFTVGGSNVSFANTDYRISFQAKVPIQGWASSGVIMSQDTDTRVVAARTFLNGSQTFTTTIVALTIPSQASFDSHGALAANGSPFTYTAPVAGFYQFSLVAYTNGNAGRCDNWWAINGNIDNGTQQIQSVGTNRDSVLNTSILKLNAGDVVTFRAYGYSPITIDGGTVSICRLSGPTAIAATESVNAKYYATAPGTANSTTPYNFDGKIYDSHGAVTTGANWRFTAPMQGKYSIKLFYNNSASLSGPAYFMIYKNGSAYQMFGSAQVAYPYGSCSVTIPMLAGEYFEIRTNSSSFPWYGNTNLAANASTLDIERVGN